VGKNGTTIEREVKLGLVELKHYLSDSPKTVYSAVIAQNRRDERSSNKGKGLKVGSNIVYLQRLEELIKQKYSPYAALQYMRNNGENHGVDICEKTVYNYIEAGHFLGLTNKDLPMKTRKKGKYRRVRTAYNNGKGTSISERPEIVDKRQEKGHWEIDLVVGKRGTSCVCLTLDERVTRKKIVIKLADKSQKSVIGALKKMRKKYRFKTITADNGGEFLDFESIEKWLKCRMYYAHPFSSWERGTNENGNRMLRRFYPKGTDFSEISQDEIDRVTDWINNYPRKILGGMSASMAFQAA
jgi:IS30 family transposase